MNNEEDATNVQGEDGWIKNTKLTKYSMLYRQNKQQRCYKCTGWGRVDNEHKVDKMNNKDATYVQGEDAWIINTKLTKYSMPYRQNR